MNTGGFRDRTSARFFASLDPPGTAETSRSGVLVSFPAAAKVSLGNTKRLVLPLLLGSGFLESSNTDLKLISAGGLYAIFGFDFGSGVENPSGSGSLLGRGRFDGRVDCVRVELKEHPRCVCALTTSGSKSGGP